MSSQHQHGVGIEHPYSHQIMIGSLVFFFLTWGLDTFYIQLFVELRNSVPLLLRILLFLMTVIISFLMMKKSESLIFSTQNEPKSLVSGGIYGFIRHPLYLSIPVLYLAFVLLSFSILSILSILVIFYFFNRMVVFEENELIKILGDEYLQYMSNVPRWIPRLKR